MVGKYFLQNTLLLGIDVLTFNQNMTCIIICINCTGGNTVLHNLWQCNAFYLMLAWRTLRTQWNDGKKKKYDNKHGGPWSVTGFCLLGRRCCNKGFHAFGWCGHIQEDGASMLTCGKGL